MGTKGKGDGSLTPFQIWRMCGRKKAYDKRKNAARIAGKHGHRVYECPICGKYHITSKEKD